MIATLGGRCYYYYCHFPGEEIEDQRPNVTCSTQLQERKESIPSSSCLPSALSLFPSKVPGLLARMWGWLRRAVFSEWNRMTFPSACSIVWRTTREESEKNGLALLPTLLCLTTPSSSLVPPSSWLGVETLATEVF